MSNPPLNPVAPDKEELEGKDGIEFGTPRSGEPVEVGLGQENLFVHDQTSYRRRQEIDIPRHHHIRPPVGVPNGSQGCEHFFFREASHRVHSTVLGSGYTIRCLKLVLWHVVCEGDGGLGGQVRIRRVRNTAEPSLGHRGALCGPLTMTEVLARSARRLWSSLVRSGVATHGKFTRRKGRLGKLVLV